MIDRANRSDDLVSRLAEASRRLAAAGDRIVPGRRHGLDEAARRLAALCPEPLPDRPATPDEFAGVAIHAICAASVNDAVAARTFERCRQVLQRGGTARVSFRHPSKADAIDRIWHERERLFRDYAEAADKLAFIGGLPWMGQVTKRRLARRLGLLAGEDAAAAPSARRALSAARA